MRTLAMLASSSLMLLLACGDKVVEDSGPGDSDTAGGSGSDGDGGTGGGSGGGASDGGGSGTPSSEQPPTMSNADAYCYQHQTGEEFWTWTVTGQADDPQGIDTLEAVVPDGVVVRVDGAERARVSLACDATGACSASFGEEEVGALCAEAGRSTFELTAIDEDGNRSEPAVVIGRQQR